MNVCFVTDFDFLPFISFILDFTKAFSLFDYDKDGIISNDDMRIVLKSLGHKISDHDLDELIKSIDRNGKYFLFLRFHLSDLLYQSLKHWNSFCLENDEVRTFRQLTMNKL